MNERILKILQERYLLEGESDWNDIVGRVAGIYPPVKPLLEEMRFLPSTPTLANYDPEGRTTGGLSSCFPLPLEDSMEGIGDAMKDCMLITKYSGGVGYIFSNLRSTKESVKGCNNSKAGGGLSFERMFNKVLDEVQQGGRRRGAGMAAYDIDYPDILDVIDSKTDVNDLRYSKFNHSIRVTDKFYEQLLSSPDSPHIVRTKKGEEAELKDGEGNIVSVRQLWDKILHSAWLCAEPGILNVDRMAERNPITDDKRIIGQNPCAEFVHVVNSSCNLGSFNLMAYVKKSPAEADGNEYCFDWVSLKKDIAVVAAFMDSVIDKNHFPTKAIEKTTKDVRPIGVGVMGLGHALIMLGIPYSSEKAAEFVEHLLLFLEFSIKLQSARNAIEKGPYPAFSLDRYLEANKKLFVLADKCDDVKQIKDEFLETFAKRGIRNSVCTSIAPTGSLSYLADTSGGIEPLFALRYFRKIETGVDKHGKSIYRNEAMLDPILEKWCEEHGKNTDKVLEYLDENGGSLQGCSELGKNEQELFKIASELTVDEHLRILAAASGSVSTSVSKTLNLPNKITKEQMGDVFLKAWRQSIIGVTVYRDGCREGILTTSNEEAKAQTIERPKEIPAEMHHFNLRSSMTEEDGTEHVVVRPYFVCVGVLNGMPYEIFSSMSNHTEPGREKESYIPKHLKTGKIVKDKARQYRYIEESTGESFFITGKHTLPEANLINRLVSLGFRNGVSLEDIVEQLTKANAITDYGQVITRYIKHYLKDGAKTSHSCDVCGNSLIRAEGCLKCPSCGWAKCG